MKEFNVGDVVWWAKCGRNDVSITCPVCIGKRKVVVILGDGEQVETDCDYCGKGYEGARGVVTEYQWVAAIEQVSIDKKEVNESEKGRSVEYRHGYHCLDSTNVFDTKEGAEARVEEMIETHNKEESDRIARGKYNNLKSYSWHVGYHQRELKRAQHDMEYHSKKIVAMKLLAKDKIV